MTKELLQQALVNVHDAILRGNSDGELLVMIDDALRDAKAQQEQPASVDAYVGAREDAAIWKKRALEAEELNRKFIAELNGPTYLGEPAQQEQPTQAGRESLESLLSMAIGVIIGYKTRIGYKADSVIDKFVRDCVDRLKDWPGTSHWYTGAAQVASATWTEMVVVNLVREGVNKHRARELAAHFLTLPARPAIKDDIGVACLETMVKTMTNLGLATDASLEGFGARLESNIYAMCRAVDGLFKVQPAQEPVAWLHGTTFQVVVSKNRPNSLAAWLPLFAHPAPTQPALNDGEIYGIVSKAADELWPGISRVVPWPAEDAEFFEAIVRKVEAHCRGGAGK